MSGYAEFLASKVKAVPDHGFDVDRLSAETHLKPFQQAIVKWALRKGRAAIFADTGLGKTRMQLVWADEVCFWESGTREINDPYKVLILAPLAVAQQTVREGLAMGLEVRYVRSQAEVGRGGIYITNYEMLKEFDPDAFVGVVLDESSILKSYAGVTKRLIVEAFARTPYRLACTATPSPNDTTELGNHSEFLGVMGSTEMLSRWFANDTTQAGRWWLKGHAEADFWAWVATWAVCVSKPSDLPNPAGEPYSDEGYVLPPLTVRSRVVRADVSEEVPDGQLIRTPSMSAANMHREMRLTAPARAAEVAAVVAAEPGEQWLVWCNTDYEAQAIREALALHGVPFQEVRGPDPLERKTQVLNDFATGGLRVLLTKPSIAGMGMNFQGCARTAYVGLSYSYEEFYQSVRRFWRYGQAREVLAYVVMADTEQAVMDSIQAKQAEHERLKARMVDAMAGRLARHSHVNHVGGMERASGRGFEVFNGDCVEGVRGLEPDSVDFQIFSPPFANLYVYSPSERDMGNCADNDEFFQHFGYLIPELLRVLKPGRLAALHVKNMVVYKNRAGYSGLYDFRGDVIRAMQAARGADGSFFAYHSEVCIWTDPVREMQRTKAHGLLYKTLKADSSMTRNGVAEHLVVFRKWHPELDNAEPIAHSPEDFPLDLWQRYASPVWFDIDRTDVLNVKLAREDKDEKHLAPLQLEVIRRALKLWTNPGDLVLTPFLGIGSELYVALEQGRRGVGFELKRSYFGHAVKNLRAMEEATDAPLLGLLEGAAV